MKNHTKLLCIFFRYHCKPSGVTVGLQDSQPNYNTLCDEHRLILPTSDNRKIKLISYFLSSLMTYYG